jgi:hypothetical protein
VAVFKIASNSIALNLPEKVVKLAIMLSILSEFLAIEAVNLSAFSMISSKFPD